MTGKLILCATPIGNLSDVSERLRATLASADLIYAEDTRRAAKLLSALDVSVPVRSYFLGNETQRAAEVRKHLEDGQTLVMISDAGMPSIADPGVSAVRVAVDIGAEVTAIPGPSAVTTALAVSGLPAERFVFEGFLPRKQSDRNSRLALLAVEERTVVLFSGKSKVVTDLSDLLDSLGGDRSIVITRELTKAYEEVWRGTLAEAVDHWSTRLLRGEFTLVVGGAGKKYTDFDRIVAEAVDAIEAGESMADAVRRIATESGVGRRKLYEAVLHAHD